MSVGKKVEKALRELDAGDPTEALYQICSAIDATATKEYGARNHRTYKQFIGDNLGLIFRAGLGHRVLNFNVECSDPALHPDASGLCSIQQVLYHVARCGLVHETEVGPYLKFGDKTVFKVEAGAVTLPAAIVVGLIIAVLVSPVNCGESCPLEMGISAGGFSIPISKLWGKRTELEALYNAMDAFR